MVETYLLLNDNCIKQAAIRVNMTHTTHPTRRRRLKRTHLRPIKKKPNPTKAFNIFKYFLQSKELYPVEMKDIEVGTQPKMKNREKGTTDIGAS